MLRKAEKKSALVLQQFVKCMTSSTTGFYPSTFVCSCFPPKIQFLYCLLIHYLTRNFLKFRSPDC